MGANVLGFFRYCFPCCFSDGNDVDVPSSQPISQINSSGQPNTPLVRTRQANYTTHNDAQTSDDSHDFLEILGLDLDEEDDAELFAEPVEEAGQGLILHSSYTRLNYGSLIEDDQFIDRVLHQCNIQSKIERAARERKDAKHYGGERVKEFYNYQKAKRSSSPVIEEDADSILADYSLSDIATVSDSSDNETGFTGKDSYEMYSMSMD